MTSSNEQMQMEFHNKANAVFFSINHSFEDAVSKVSRRNEEFKFQQLKKQYAEVMEHELQLLAKDILSRYRTEKQVAAIDQMFRQFIRDYVHRFIQKVNDL